MRRKRLIIQQTPVTKSSRQSEKKKNVGSVLDSLSQNKFSVDWSFNCESEKKAVDEILFFLILDYGRSYDIKLGSYKKLVDSVR